MNEVGDDNDSDHNDVVDEDNDLIDGANCHHDDGDGDGNDDHDHDHDNDDACATTTSTDGDDDHNDVTTTAMKTMTMMLLLALAMLMMMTAMAMIEEDILREAENIAKARDSATLEEKWESENPAPILRNGQTMESWSAAYDAWEQRRNQSVRRERLADECLDDGSTRAPRAARRQRASVGLPMMSTITLASGFHPRASA